MNNQPNSNQNSTPRQPSQSQPLNVVLKKGSIQVLENLFLAPIRVLVTKGINPQANVLVLFKKGNETIGTAVTDEAGEATINHHESHAMANNLIEIRALALGIERAISFALPKVPPPPKTDNDPEQMWLTRNHDNNGNYHIFARVIGKRGIALANITVTFRFKNVLTEVNTNAQGYAEININSQLNPGESLMVYATVSGLAEEARIILRRSPDWPTRFKGEWFKSMFGIAAIARWVMYAFWIIMLIVIMTTDYQPLLLKNPTELSKQQELFNQRSRPDQKIVLKENGKEFPGNFLLVMLGVTTVVLIGSAVVNRRRILFALTTSWDRLSDRWMNHAIDPMAERVLDWMKVLNVAKKDKNADGVLDEKDKETDGSGEGHRKPIFWKMFGSDVLSELFTGALILLLKGGKFSKYA